MPTAKTPDTTEDCTCCRGCCRLPVVARSTTSDVAFLSLFQVQEIRSRPKKKKRLQPQEKNPTPTLDEGTSRTEKRTHSKQCGAWFLGGGGGGGGGVAFSVPVVSIVKTGVRSNFFVFCFLFFVFCFLFVWNAMTNTMICLTLSECNDQYNHNTIRWCYQYDGSECNDQCNVGV